MTQNTSPYSCFTLSLRRGQGEVAMVNSYYPFGMNIKGLTTFNGVPTTKAYQPNEYLYNGNPDSYREFQDELGLDLLDYGARFYDATLSRFHIIDPMAETYSFQSPFAYAANNPIKFIDVNGMSPGNPPGGYGRLIIEGMKHAGMSQEQISASTQQMGENGLIAAGMTGLVALVGIETLPILQGGSIEFLTAAKLSPEMLKYIAIRYPTLYETIVAIIVTEATPPGQAPLSPMTVQEFRYLRYKLLMQLEGDTRSPEQKPKPKPEQRPKSKSEQKPKPEPEQKPKPEPDQKPKPKPEQKLKIT